ncbi:MAG: EamA family transporter [Acidimicrobiales bacterium]
MLIAGACVAWGFDNGVTARIDQLSPQHVVFLKGLIAGTANLVLGLITADTASTVRASDVIGALAIGAAGYGASIVLWVKGARDLGAARGQLVFATAPFLAPSSPGPHSTKPSPVPRSPPSPSPPSAAPSPSNRPTNTDTLTNRASTSTNTATTTHTTTTTTTPGTTPGRPHTATDTDTDP